jgi:hypothetical protein
MILALLNTKPGTWPAEPVNPSKPCKSMTRRVINPQPTPERGGESEFDASFWSWKKYECEDVENMKYLAPFKDGDVLWVRESWTCVDKDSVIMKALISYEDGTLKWVQFNDIDRYEKCVKYYGKKRPSIFLQREAARLFLEVKSVRVERVQDITEKDAKAEGIDRTHRMMMYAAVAHANLHDIERVYRDEFKLLWDELNAHRKGASWNDNPFIFVYEFMRLENAV